MARSIEALRAASLGARIAARASLTAPALTIFLASLVLSTALYALGLALQASLAASSLGGIAGSREGPVRGSGLACVALLESERGSVEAWAVSGSSWDGPRPGSGGMLLGWRLAEMLGVGPGGLVRVEASGADGVYVVEGVLHGNGPVSVIAVLPDCSGAPLLSWGRLYWRAWLDAAVRNVVGVLEQIVAVAAVSSFIATAAGAGAACKRLSPSIVSALYYAPSRLIYFGVGIGLGVHASAGASAGVIAASAVSGAVSKGVYLPPHPLVAASLVFSLALAVAAFAASCRVLGVWRGRP